MQNTRPGAIAGQPDGDGFRWITDDGRRPLASVVGQDLVVAICRPFCQQPVAGQLGQQILAPQRLKIDLVAPRACPMAIARDRLRSRWPSSDGSPTSRRRVLALHGRCSDPAQVAHLADFQAPWTLIA